MPEYHLPIEASCLRSFNDLDEFTQGYIEAMFFTYCSDPDDGELEGRGYGDLSQTALVTIIADCKLFQEANADLLQRAETLGEAQACYDMERAGNDYWYSRNGHGVGFWDRGLGEVGELLHKACQYREVYVYLGDDDMVHVS